MDVGIRLHDVAEGTIEQRVAIAHEQGFKCAHIALSKLISEYSTGDAALTPGLAMYLKKLFAKNDVDIAVLGNYLNLATPDRDALKKNTDRYMTHLRFASMLGCGVVGTETGAPNTDYHFEAACHTEEAYRIFVENFKPVVECAEKFGVIIAIEPVVRHIIYDAQRARRLLDEIGSPNLQIILDPVNLLDTWNWQDQKQIVREAIDVLGDDVAIVHVKDYNMIDGKFVSGPAGTGIMDYSDLAEFIRRDKPHIQCTLEETTPENAVACREFWCRQCGQI